MVSTFSRDVPRRSASSPGVDSRPISRSSSSFTVFTREVLFRIIRGTQSRARIQRAVVTSTVSVTAVVAAVGLMTRDSKLPPMAPAIVRETMSVGPPAVNPTTIRIGLEG